MKTIFIVDDQETSLLSAKIALDGIFKTYTFTSAEQMFKFAEKIIPDMILLDVKMPNMNGYEAMQIIISNEKLKSVPVIFLTAKNDAESEIQGFELKAVDFITKPFSPPVLLKRIETHIGLNNLFKEIQHKNEELIKIHALKNNILAMIAHDMKNYIKNIQKSLEIINTEHNGFDNNKCIKMMTDSSIKALALVKDILNLNSLEIWSDTECMVICDIRKFVADSHETFSTLASQKNIDMTFDLENEPLFCTIDSVKLQRVFDNLCINAIKFTQPNGTINISATKTNNMAQISVTDTGLGIEKEMIDKLFDEYTIAGRTGTTGEDFIGLGLYLVKQIIIQHNGTIEVQSEVGKGSSFILKLPIAKNM